MLSNNQAYVQETLVRILEDGTFAEKRRKVIRWWNDFVHEDDRHIFQPLLDMTISTINEMELAAAETAQAEHQRDIAFDKVAESESVIRDQAVLIIELQHFIQDNFAKSDYFQVFEELGAELGEHRQ